MQFEREGRQARVVGDACRIDSVAGVNIPLYVFASCVSVQPPELSTGASMKTRGDGAADESCIGAEQFEVGDHTDRIRGGKIGGGVGVTPVRQLLVPVT